MNFDDVKYAIKQGNFTNAQLNELGEAIRFARTRLVKENKRAFKVGDSVKFTHRGSYKFGTVESIKIKNVIIRTGPYGTYRVPANMLEAHTE